MTYDAQAEADKLALPMRRWAAHGLRVGLLDINWGAGGAAPDRLRTYEGLPSARFLAAFRGALGTAGDASELERRMNFGTRVCDLLHEEQSLAVERRYAGLRNGQALRFVGLIGFMLVTIAGARWGYEGWMILAWLLLVGLSVVGHRSVALADGVLTASAFPDEPEIRMPWEAPGGRRDVRADVRDDRGFASEAVGV